MFAAYIHRIDDEDNKKHLDWSCCFAVMGQRVLSVAVSQSWQEVATRRIDRLRHKQDEIAPM